MSTYTLQETRVLCDGREELKHREVSTAVLAALRRKLRKHGHDRSFFRRLKQYGEASITWNFVHKIRKNDDHWVTFQAWALEDEEYHLDCVGPQAEHAIERINMSLEPKRAKRVRKKRTSAQRARARSRRWLRSKKRRLDREAKQRERDQKKKKQKRLHGAVSSHQLEQLTPQFRKSRIFWNEALDATVAIFDIQRDGKNTARSIAARRLWRSLEHTGYRFAQIRQEGFCLQFTIADGRWRGVDLTPVTVSCTKDNRNPVYRRMRKWMRRKLHGHSPPEQRTRHDLLWGSDTRIAA